MLWSLVAIDSFFPSIL